MITDATASFSVTREWNRFIRTCLWSLPPGQKLKRIECSAPDGVHYTSVNYTNNNCYGATIQIGDRTGPISHINNGNWVFTFIYESGIKQSKTFYAGGGHEGWYINTRAYYIEFDGNVGGALASNRSVTVETVHY